MSDKRPNYAVHIRPAARAELRDIYNRLLNRADVSVAGQWYSALQFILAELSTDPGLYAPSRESRLLRSEVCRASSGQTAKCCLPYSVHHQGSR